MTTLIFNYIRISDTRYLRELKIQGEEDKYMVVNPLNLGVVEIETKEDLRKDFNKYKDKIGSVRLSLINRE